MTNVSTRRWADPFGGARGTSPTGWTGDHGFLNKVADATGLTAVGARFYDSLIGRFVSVDPVLNGADPQQWNGYAYSQNNPVTWSDPSGLLSWGSAWNAVKKGASAAGGWVQKHQAQIVGIAVGIAVTAGCMAITVGAGSIACAAAGGAAAGAVTNLWASKVAHTQTFSWKSLMVDTVVGGVIGAATGGLGKLAAPLMSRAGTAIATTAKTVAARAPAAIRAATGAVGRAASSTARAALRSEARAGAAEATEAGASRVAAGAEDACAGGACQIPGQCFVAGTGVLLGSGATVAIEDVKIGDRVLTTDPATGKESAHAVTRLYRHENASLYDVVIDGSTVTATPTHPFWVVGRGWVTVDQLHPGDDLLQPDDTTVTVDAVTATGKTATVYNFEVEDAHDYYVKAGNHWILVHNTCGGSLRIPGSGTRLTSSQATQMADRVGYRPTNFISRGERVFTNGKTFITQDTTAHTGGLWKMASSVQDLRAGARLGTYDYDLNWIAP